MANTLSKTGIQDENIVRVWHVTQSIDAFTKVSAYDITLSGSLTIDGPTNLSLPVTGTLITSASYSISSSYSINGLTASNTSYADISRDTFFLQLSHGTFKNPLSSSSYFFAVNPLKGSGDSLPTSSIYVGTNYPTDFNIVSATLAYARNGTIPTGSANFEYILWVNGNSYHFSDTINPTASFASISQDFNIPYTNNYRPIYIELDTGAWTTGPQYISHNLVLYCDRGYNPI